MQFEPVADALETISQSGPLTAVICVVGLVICFAVASYYNSRTVETVFDNIHILSKLAVTLALTIGALVIAYSLPSGGSVLRFLVSVVAAMGGVWFGVVQFTKQKETTEGA